MPRRPEKGPGTQAPVTMEQQLLPLVRGAVLSKALLRVSSRTRISPSVRTGISPLPV